MSYTAPIKDMLFAINELANLDRISMLPGFEEATRALFANDRTRFEELIAGWPGDVRDHAVRLAFAE